MLDGRETCCDEVQRLDHQRALAVMVINVNGDSHENIT
jgi:hypothetical protein